MTTRTALLAGALAVALAAPAWSQELRVGYLNTMTGGGAALGVPLTNGWKLGLAHEGWTKDGDKLGGVPTKIFYGDDQQKPDVALREIDRLVKGDKVQILAGFAWSNIANASRNPIVQGKVPMLILNAGSGAIAGELCSPYITSTSFNNDQGAEALGALMSKDNLKTIYLLAPNFQAGKDMFAGIARTLKGPKVVGRTLYRLGQSDFQADISKIRAMKPEALFVFGPGAMGIAFMKQWAASGAGKEIKLYTVYTIDYESLRAIGDAAIGTYHTNWWSADGAVPENQRFVKEYVAKYGRMPSHFAAQGYDGARLLAAAVKTLGGKFDDGLAFAKALRHTKFPSVRGDYLYNVNGMPIQDFLKREVVKGPDGKVQIVGREVIFKAYKDSYWEKCPPAQRL
ncbi:MAG: ABC transporter substrate-binding protein [Rhodospirillaceae bacterium]|nr:ABC transporter substrate-binding protein [Rhodospirillaceae bacterium]